MKNPKFFPSNKFAYFEKKLYLCSGFQTSFETVRTKTTQKQKTIKLLKTMKKEILVMVALVGLLTACHTDVQLNDFEDTPQVAEHILGMSTEEATKYLESKGFRFGGKAEYSNEYSFSKDKNLSEFSYDASIMFMFGTFTSDTVQYAHATQIMETEKSAYDLYWKWSHYTAYTTLPKPSNWRGYIGVRATATEGQTWKDFSTGEQEQFWAQYRQAEGSLEEASESYTNNGENTQPKEIELLLYMNNGGDIELNYETFNFNRLWEDTAP